MSNPRHALDTEVENSRALLPDPPDYWSYSSLVEFQGCPLRYALARSSYPELWSGRGYPPLPTVAALFGRVVHGSLETVVKAFSAVGIASTRSAEAATALRSIGGITAVVEAEATNQLAALCDNPRVDDDRRRRIVRDLRARAPEARAQVQAYLGSTAFAPKAPPFTSSYSESHSRSDRWRGLGDGSHAEVNLFAKDLRLRGRIDLLTVYGTSVGLVDFKTGIELPEHLDQLRLYALLWERDRLANPGRLATSSLTAVYLGRNVSVEVPSATELQELAETITSQVSRADSVLESGSPTPVPSESNCHFCGVRQLCEAYWQDIAPKLPDVEVGTWFDYEGRIGGQNGQRSWWVLNPTSKQCELMLQTTTTTPLFGEGDRVRILQLHRGTDPDVPLPLATLTAASEVFRLSA